MKSIGIGCICIGVLASVAVIAGHDSWIVTGAISSIVGLLTYYGGRKHERAKHRG